MMAKRSMCDEKERLIAYVYGDCEDKERQQMAAHIAVCAACAEEADALQNMRGHLATWTPPDLALGFKVVREESPRPARRFWPQPAWGLAMAAAVVLMATMAAARLEIQVGNGSVVVRSAWANDARQAPGLATTSESPAQPWRAALSALEQRLRGELEPERAANAPAAVPAPATSDGDVLRRVRTLIQESEQRQKQELALRLAQVVQDFDRQRQVDLIRIQQGFGRIEGQNSAEAARQREALNYLMRVSQRQ
jgi:hypothetical protein